jgi:DNA-binding NtrC family response regulator
MTTPSDSVTLVAIDDDAQALELVASALEQDGLEILTETNPAKGLELILRRRPQIVILDLIMPKMSGMDLLARVVEADPGADVILLTGHYSIESAVEAIQKGACDYFTKPISVEKLRDRIGQLLQDARQRQRAVQLERELLDASQFEGIIGRGPMMLEVFARIRRVAPHFRTALITGPTGTGKELVARALHRLSPSSGGPFVVCNCAAVVETLFESELFGYVRGAFTGATKDKMGMFEYANGGTLLLDEIGDMPLATQTKLLRVLQNQEIQRVGSPVVRKVDVRVLAATNRNLETLVAEQKFRDDLYYRLSMVEIRLPPLADRKEDLPLLERHFVERFAAQYSKPIAGLTRRAQTLLGKHSWPGNVRELENVLGHACMMAVGSLIDVKDFPERFRSQSVLGFEESDELISIEELQRRHARRVLEKIGGNKVKAAEILGISRATLYRLLADEKEAAEAKAEEASEDSPEVT